MPVNAKWSLSERPGFLRLHALPTPDLWHARNTLTQQTIGPRSTATVVIETAGLKPGDVSGLALFNRPYACLGVERDADGATLTQSDETNGRSARAPVKSARVWLRADCDFIKNAATFRYRMDGRIYNDIGGPCTMVYALATFQGVRYSLFAYNTHAGAEAGYADFDSIEVKEDAPHRIPTGQRIELSIPKPTTFTVVDLGLGRVALRTDEGFVSVNGKGAVSLHSGSPGTAEGFQLIETFDGDIVLLSLATNRYLRVDPVNRQLIADSPGRRPDGRDGVRFHYIAAQ